MAVRIGQVSIVRAEVATSPYSLESEIMNCSAFPTARALISVFIGKADDDTALTINNWKFDFGGTNQTLTEVADANSDDIMVYAHLQNPTAIDAKVTLEASAASGGASSWNGILVTMLLYEVAQSPDAIEVSIDTDYGALTDIHTNTVASHENKLHLTFVGVDGSSAGGIVPFTVNDGHFVWANDSVDGTHNDTRSLNLNVTGINGDQYADRNINVTWDGGGRADFWAIDVLIDNYKHIHVDIPGSIGVPGHIIEL